MTDPVAWPSDLDWFAEHGSWTETAEPNVTRFDVGVGPPKTRRKHYGPAIRLEFSRIMYSAELEQFLDFYQDDLNSGELNFTALDPRTEVLTEYQFMAEPSWQDIGPGLWKLRFSLRKSTPVTGEYILRVPFDGADGATSAVDQSLYARVLTFSGNAQLDTAVKKFGSASLLLDGTGDYVLVDAPTGISRAVGEAFTMHAWIRPTALADFDTIFSSCLGSDESFWFRLHAGGQIAFATWSAPGVLSGYGESAAGAVVINTQQHVAVTIDASNVMRLFVGGVLVNTQSSVGAMREATANASIGSVHSFGEFFVGHIDQLEVIKGAALWTAAFTPPA